MNYKRKTQSECIALHGNPYLMMDALAFWPNYEETTETCMREHSILTIVSTEKELKNKGQVAI